MATFVRWRFDDTTDSTFAEFEVNPNSGGSPTRARTITSKNTLVPGGNTVLFEGAKDPQTITFSGVILSESMLNLMSTWFSKKHQIKVTDDLGRQFFIMETKFEPKRVRSSNPWKHTYVCTCTVVDWP